MPATVENKELRVIRKPLELRVAKGDDGGDVFSGYVFAWDAESDDLGGFVEVIRRGAAKKVIESGRNVRALLNHQMHVEKTLGDTAKGRLRLWEDAKGLAFEVRAIGTTSAKDAALVVDGSESGMSFAFIKGQDRWSTLPDGRRLRELLEFSSLEEISIVVDAAYKSSDVTVAKRSLEEHVQTEQRNAAAAPARQQEVPPAAPVGPSIEYLRRLMNLDELETRWGCGDSPAIASQRPEPTHFLYADAAHDATGRAMDTKQRTNAPSRALELRAAEAHRRAGLTALEEEKPAAAEYHDAMARAHEAAAQDEYAAQYSSDGPFWRNPEESRANPHHDEDGLFHDGSPQNLLSAARGRLQKAQQRHAAACGAQDVSAEYRSECRQGHADAVAAAEQAIPAADSAHAAMLAEHRAAIDASRQEHNRLIDSGAQYASPGSPLVPVPANSAVI
jgi:uncharacterized protein